MRNKKYAAIGATAVLTFSVGTAYAYWTTSGSGSGSATTASGVTSTLSILGPGATEGTSALTGLAPVAESATFTGYTPVKVVVKNTGAERQALTSITPSFTVTSGTNKVCDASNFSLTKVENGDVSVAAGQTSAEVTVGQFALVNSTSNQDGCKGATINFTFSANPVA